MTIAIVVGLHNNQIQYGEGGYHDEEVRCRYKTVKPAKKMMLRF